MRKSLYTMWIVLLTVVLAGCTSGQSNSSEELSGDRIVATTVALTEIMDAPKIFTGSTPIDHVLVKMS